MSSYLDYSGRDDAASGGARMIPVNTPLNDDQQTYFSGLIEFLHGIGG